MTNGSHRYAVFSPEGSRLTTLTLSSDSFYSKEFRGAITRKGRLPFRFGRLEVDGGGHWELDEAKSVLQLSGHSKSYGGVDLKPLAAELRDADVFRQYEWSSFNGKAFCDRSFSTTNGESDGMR